MKSSLNKQLRKLVQDEVERLRLRVPLGSKIAVVVQVGEGIAYLGSNTTNVADWFARLVHLEKCVQCKTSALDPTGRCEEGSR